MNGEPIVRFDDRRFGRARSWELRRWRATMVAERAGEVAGALAEAERWAAKGCWVGGYVAYEAAAGLDPDLVVHAGPLPSGEPLVWFAAFDECVAAPLRPLAPVARSEYSVGPLRPSLDAERYRLAVGAVRDRIERGDVYQVNLTDRLVAPFAGEPGSLYAHLLDAQRGGYHAYLDTGGCVIVSASPELFVRIDGERIMMRPMKGTARRGLGSHDDALARDALLSSAKERAENVMIVDLVRNDLARIGDRVHVDALFTVEQYPTVWQMTSTVSARRRSDTGIGELFRAVFPPGSVTGAPKISAMRRIVELEAGPRGVYCGAIGWLAPGGSARFSVAIRTAVVSADRRTLTYGAGGGITWDSSAGAEHAELVAKTAVLTSAPWRPELFETMRYEPGTGIELLEHHLDRLESSARLFDIAFDRNLARVSVKAVEEPQARRVRLVLRGDGSIEVSTSAAPEPLGRPVRLAIDDDPVDPAQPLWYHKSVERSRYESRRARHPSVDDVVLVNGRGEVTETTIANLAVRMGERWYTPPVTSGCLAGVARRVALEAGRVHERPITIEDLRHADELAVMNALRGWQPAVLVAD